MCRKVLKHLKADVIWFDHPVEVKYAPDYYHVIKNPMDLGTIQQRLKQKKYASPMDFLEVSLQAASCMHGVQLGVSGSICSVGSDLSGWPARLVCLSTCTLSTAMVYPVLFILQKVPESR